MKLIVSLIIVLVQLNILAQSFNVDNVKKLGSEINAESSEESIPLISKDLGKMFFVRSIINEEQELAEQNIYESKYDGNFNFSNSSEFNKLNTKLNNAILGINSDGTKLYLLDSYSKSKTAGIAFSDYKNGKWSKPQRLDIPGLLAPNTLFGFHVSNDGNVIILAYKEPRSLGQEDLFVTTNIDGKWSSPIHMGNSINSPGFEISPFLSPSKDTLFFSSNGHEGLGDADIFYSVKGSSWSDWSKPVNLGVPINSDKFDAYFMYTGSSVFWASNRGQKFSDIYTATMNPLPALSLDIVATNCSKYNVNDGQAKLEITGGAEPYVIKWMDGNTEVNRTNLKPGEYSVVVSDKFETEVSGKIFITQPIEETPVLSFEQYFDYNSISLNKVDDLNKLVQELKQLKANSEVSIKIFSSASTVPTRKYVSNQDLADKRAKELFNYITNSMSLANLKITIESVVGGPEYSQDAGNLDKYRSHQFVKVIVQ